MSSEEDQVGTGSPLREILLHEAKATNFPKVFAGPERPDHPIVYYMEPADSGLLMALARTANVKTYVETGSYSGTSARNMIQIVDDVWSIDNGTLDGSKIPGFGIEPEVHPRIHFVYGTGYSKLPWIPVKHPWMFLHDSDHGYQNVMLELDTAWAMNATAFACHDIYHCKNEGCEAAWDDFVAKHDIRMTMKSKSRIGMGFALRP